MEWLWNLFVCRKIALASANWKNAIIVSLYKGKSRKSTVWLYARHRVCKPDFCSSAACWEVHKCDQVYCMFVDLEKAYDKVNRLDLWNPLPRYEVKLELMNAVRVKYDWREACVRIDWILSKLWEKLPCFLELHQRTPNEAWV